LQIYLEITGQHHIKKKELKQKKNMIDKKLKIKKEKNITQIIYLRKNKQ
jgi:hypothetical protein